MARALPVVVAIDPGTRTAGIAVWALGGDKGLLEVKKIKVTGKKAVGERIYEVGTVLESVLGRFNVKLLVIEEIPAVVYRGHSGWTTAALHRAIGAFEWIARSAGVPVTFKHINEARRELEGVRFSAVHMIEDEDERAAVTLALAGALNYPLDRTGAKA